MKLDVLKNKIIYKWRSLITETWYRLLLNYLGAKSVIYRPIIISGLEYLNVGNNVIIFENNRIEIIDSYCGKNFNPEMTIGNNTQIHQNCHITCAGKISIGDNVVIVAGVTITDINHPYTDINVPINQQPIEVSKVIIGERSYIYNNAVILPNTIIGKHCVIGANSVVSGTIPDYSIVVGAPGKIVRKYCCDANNWIKCK